MGNHGNRPAVIVAITAMLAFASIWQMGCAGPTLPPGIWDLWGAAAGGDAGSQVSLGNSYLNGFGVARDPHEAVKWFRMAAEQGNVDGECSLGDCYDAGTGVDQDKPEAFRWYRKAAEQGNAAAQYGIGYYYANGIGVDQDPKEAVKWYRKAADQGVTEAELALATCYQVGVGVERDEQEAQKWLGESKTEGVVVEKQLAGQVVRIHPRPTPTPLSPRETQLAWDDKLDSTNIDAVLRTYAYSGDDQTAAAKVIAENTAAYATLQKAVIVKWGRDAETVVLHAAGANTRADDAQATVYVNDPDHVELRFVEKTLGSISLVRVDREWKVDIAAMIAGVKLETTEDGYRHGTAIVNSGTAGLAAGKYAGAEQLAKDLGVQFDLLGYRQDAEQGVAEAQFKLGLYYANGIGVEKNPQEAVKWYRKAADQGNFNAQFDLAMCYQTGVGVDEDQQEAQKWFRKALTPGVTIAGMIARQVGQQIARRMMRPTPTPLSPRQTLLNWDDQQLENVDDIMRTYAYSGDDQTVLAKLTAEEIVAYTKLQKAVIAKWGKDGEALVLHAAGTSTRADDEQTVMVVNDPDHVVLNFRLDTIGPVSLVRVGQEWKLDIAAMAAGAKLDVMEEEARQYTAIMNAATAGLAAGKYTDAEQMAKEIKEQVGKIP